MLSDKMRSSQSGRGKCRMSPGEDELENNRALVVDAIDRRVIRLACNVIQCPIVLGSLRTMETNPFSGDSTELLYTSRDLSSLEGRTFALTGKPRRVHNADFLPIFMLDTFVSFRNFPSSLIAQSKYFTGPSISQTGCILLMYR